MSKDDELEELEASLKLAMKNQLERIEQSNESYQPISYESIMQGASASEWKETESKRGFGYSGPPAARTEREHRQKARKAEEINKEIRKGFIEWKFTGMGRVQRMLNLR